MKTYLLDGGNNQLTQQYLGNVANLVLTGFKVGDAVGFNADSAMTEPEGNLVFTGTNANMRYILVTQTEALIECIIDRDVAETACGNIVVYANNEPFCVSVAEYGFIKLTNISDTAVGSRMIFRLVLNLPGLTTRFSFANLTMNSVQMAQYDDEQSIVRLPYEEAHDQLIIDEHSKTASLVPVLNAWNDYWGCPLAMRLDDSTFWKIDGGTVGDSHYYVFTA